MTKYQSDKEKLDGVFKQVADLLLETDNRSVQYVLILFLLLKAKQTGWLWREGKEALMVIGTVVGERLIPLFERLWKEGGETVVYSYINTALRVEYHKMRSDKKVIDAFIQLNPKLTVQ